MKTIRQIKEQISVPAIGQTLSRDLMPQIDSAFLKYLKSKDISFTKEQLNTSDLKSTQSEFDGMKIVSLMHQNDSDPIFVSNDNYVLDGHHRWIADHNTDGKTEAYVIDLPILELLRVAKEYESMLKEEVTHKDFGPMMDAFVSFASDKLGIKSLPKINYKNDDEHGDQPSFGGYNPSSSEIVICTKNRHPMDVFRTLAHELVHHKQNEDGRIKDVSKEGATGSPIEDEANSLAGRLMRMFGKSNPDMFALSHIVESKYTNVEEGSLHKWFKSKSSDGKRGWVQIGGKYHGKSCARQPGQTSTPKCRSSGEAARMTKDEIKYAVAKKRREDPNQPEKTGSAKPTRVATYKEKKMNEEKDIKSKGSGKKDACYYKVKARYDVWPSAYASGALVKCRKAGADNWGKKSVDEQFSEITEANKDRVVLGQTLTAGQKMAAAVRKSKKGKKAQKLKDYTSAYSMMNPEALVKAQVSKYAPKNKETVKKSDVVYRKHPGVYAPTLPPATLPSTPPRVQQPATQQQSKEKPSFITKILKALRLKEENTPTDREWGKSSLTKIYADATPEQMFPFQPLFEKKKFVRKKKLEEDGLLGSTLDIYNTPYTLPSSDTIGPEFGNRYSGISGFGTGVHSSIGTGYSYPFGTLAEGDVMKFPERKKETTPEMKYPEIHPANDEMFDNKNSVHQWHNSRVLSPDGPQSRVTPTEAFNNYKEFMERHKNNRDFGKDTKSVTEFMSHWKKYSDIKMGKSKSGDSFINVNLHMPPKSIKKIQEAWEAIGGRDMGTVEKGTDEKKFVDEDWQKVNRRDKTDGLSQAAVNAYRRENPGSKLQTAVTEKNPKGKRAKRRLSFCRRMGGMKKRLTSAKTARDPDSRINKALRRWNCEE